MAKKRATTAERLAKDQDDQRRVTLKILRKYLSPELSVCGTSQNLVSAGATIPLELFQLATEMDDANPKLHHGTPVKKTGTVSAGGW